MPSRRYDVQQRASLTQGLDDLVSQLASAPDRGHGGGSANLVQRLGTPAAAFLQPELESLLTRYVDAGDCAARDQISQVLAAACGPAALPALLRALANDHDDADRLQLEVLGLFRAWPAEALAQVMSGIASTDAGLRRVAIWGLSVLDWSQKDEYIAVVVEAGSDADARVRAEAIGALGTVFGTGHPRARDALMAAVHDSAPDVRRSAVDALRGWPDEAVTELLVACADDADRWVRFGVAWALSGRPGGAVGGALERLSTDGDPDVRAAAREVLKRRAAR